MKALALKLVRAVANLGHEFASTVLSLARLLIALLLFFAMCDRSVPEPHALPVTAPPPSQPPAQPASR